MLLPIAGCSGALPPPSPLIASFSPRYQSDGRTDKKAGGRERPPPPPFQQGDMPHGRGGTHVVVNLRFSWKQQQLRPPPNLQTAAAAAKILKHVYGSVGNDLFCELCPYRIRSVSRAKRKQTYQRLLIAFIIFVPRGTRNIF